MYNEQIESLINLALADGVLTDKERQILIKKAEAAGIDLDEFEMVLDARLFEKQQSTKATLPTNTAPKSEKFGDVKKCPACGSLITAFSAKCGDCGHEFSNVGANASIGRLFEMLNACENERREESNSISGAFANLMTNGFGSDKYTEKKKSIISGFPIPNTKEDILEFLATAIPNAKKKGNFFTGNNPENKSHNDLAPTWMSKCEQIIMKAKFSMKEDKKTLNEIMSYANQLGIY